jgi:hypothetical protein
MTIGHLIRVSLQVAYCLTETEYSTEPTGQQKIDRCQVTRAPAGKKMNTLIFCLYARAKEYVERGFGPGELLWGRH